MRNVFFIHLSEYTAQTLGQVVDDLAASLVEGVKEMEPILPTKLEPGKVIVLRIDIADPEELEKPWL
jgi:hypothetical protein